MRNVGYFRSSVRRQERPRQGRTLWLIQVAAAAAKSLQSCPTCRDPMDCSLPGSSVHGIFQARVLEWGAIAFSRIQASSSQRKLIRRVTAGKQVSPLTSNSLEFHKALYSLFL